jgi:hypothetical protein
VDEKRLKKIRALFVEIIDQSSVVGIKYAWTEELAADILTKPLIGWK